MTDPRLDKHLQDFLTWEEDRRRRGVTLDAVVTLLQQQGTAFQVVVEHLQTTQRAVQTIGARQLRTEVDVHRYGKRIASLEHQVALISQRPEIPDWQRDESEVTGSHKVQALHESVEEITARLDEEEKRKRESYTDLRRTWRKAIITSVCALVVAGLSACGGYALSEMGHRQSSATQAKP